MNTTWSPTTRVLVIAVILLGAVWLAVMASPLLNALVISALLAYLLDPVVRLLARRTRLNRSLAAVIVYLLFLLILASIPATLGAVAVDQFHHLEEDFAAAVDALRQWLFQPIDVLGYQLHPRALLDNLEQFAGNALATLSSGSLDVVSEVTTNLLWGLAILVSLYYFLKDGHRIKPWLVGLAPGEYQAEARRLLDEIDRVWGVFLRVQILIFVVLAVLMAAGTFLVIWLFRTDLLGLSPFGLILLLILIYAAVQQVDNLWLRPQLMGKQLRLHPGLVFIGLLGALGLSGVLGAIVVVPCLATAKVVGRYVHHKLLGLCPWPPEHLDAIGEEKRKDDATDQGEPKPNYANLHPKGGKPVSEMRIIHLNVNGQAVEAQVDPEMSLLAFLREELGLTGAKDGCSEGTCGACTVIVDGEARRSCLLKMKRMDGCSVETIEGLARSDSMEQPDKSPNLKSSDPKSLHPLQYTMVREGAIQCGFCTPGMVMAGKALLDKNPAPSVEEIKKALKHNLCRCTGYRPIIVAIQEAARLLRDGVKQVPAGELCPAEDQVVGRGVARVDGVDKVTGRLKYSADLHVEGMLHAKVLRAAYPHARLLSVDTSAAERAPGVAAVLTARDVPGRNRFGIIRKDQPVFAEDRVRYLGEVVAAVYAESEAEAEAALSLIRVEYEPLPVIENPQQALAEGATVIHEDNESGNLLCHIPIRKGDVKQGFAEADVIVEGEYFTPSIEHAYLEPEACLAVPEVELPSASGGVGGVTVHVGSQSVIHDQEDIAAALDLPLEKVRVIHMPMGGGFGGKEDISVQIIAALGAVKTGRPVKFVWTRRESLLASGKRHAEHLRYRTGATRDGRLVAAEVEIYGDGGAYASATDAVLFRSASFSCGPYEIPNVKVDAYGVITNNPHGTAFRGFGNPQATFAAEVQMDRLAEALGMDPVEFRLRNILDAGDVTITGHVLQHSVGARPTLEAVREALAESGAPAPPPGKRVGVGFAASYKNVGLGGGMEDGAGAHLILQPDGSILLREGAMDMGQGSDTVMVQIAAQTLGVPFSRFHLHVGDTAEDPSGWMTTASRQTFVTGNAVYHAALELRVDLCAAVAEELDLPAGAVELTNGVFRLVDGGEPLSTLDELAAKAAAEGKTFEREYFYVAPQTYPVPEHITPGPVPGQDPGETRLHFAYSFAAQAAIVAVDEETNEVEVLKVISASDVGEPINPQGVKGQIEGGIVMGLGYGLSEEFRLEAGRPITDRYAKLGLPRITRTPEMVAISVSDPHPAGPYGAKGMGELPMSPTAAAIANAIYDAVGVRVYSLPVTPEKIAAARKK